MAKCNICGSKEFKDLNGRTGVLCAVCGSYERTRLMKLELDRLIPEDRRKYLRCLHIAPEYGLAKAIRGTFSEYIPADIDIKRYSHIEGIQYIDLCVADSISRFGKFDVVIHSHVIEHIPCNYSVALLRLHALLNENGRQLFSVPISGEFFEESLANLSDSERERRFGQFDHVRRFSPKDIHTTLGAIFKLPRAPELLSFYSEEFLSEHNIPFEATQKFTGHYCFSPSKGDVNLPS